MKILLILSLSFLSFFSRANELECLVKKEEKVINIKQEINYLSDKCNFEQLRKDLVNYALISHANPVLVEFEITDTTIGSAHALLNTDHTGSDGSTYYPAEDLLKILDFYSGKFDVKPNEKVSILKSVVEVPNTEAKTKTIYTHNTVVLYEKDMKQIILLNKLISVLKKDLISSNE